MLLLPVTKYIVRRLATLFPVLVLRAGFAICLLQFLFIAFLLLLLFSILQRARPGDPECTQADLIEACLFDKYKTKRYFFPVCQTIKS